MEEYTGFKRVTLNDTEVMDILSDNPQLTYDCLTNEYLMPEDSNGKYLGLFKFDGEKLCRVPHQSVESKFLGTVRPRNPQQKMALDMLYDENTTIKAITGKFGTGKDFLMCSAAIDLIEKKKFDKIVYVRNNIEVKDSKPIGYLPGTGYDKLLPFAMPLADHLGGIDGLRFMIEHNKIEIVHLGFIRGRDIKNSIIICSEAENMTKEHIQLLIGRVGDGSNLWINGDFKQVDGQVFVVNNGLLTAVDRLKGHKRFGYVKLEKTERSETAAMADLLD